MEKLAINQLSSHGNQVIIAWDASRGLDGVFEKEKLIINFESEIYFDLNVAVFIFFNVVVPCYHHTCLNVEKIEVCLPESVSNNMIQFLLEYHDLNRVECIFSSSLSQEFKLSSHIEYSTDSTDSYALFYGGGKDSLLSAAVLQDAYGASNVTLLRLVWDQDENNFQKKREIIDEPMQFMLNKGFKIEYVESNFHSIVKDRSIGKIPNIALYPGLMAPLIAKRKFEQLSHGYDVAHFHEPINVKRSVPFKLVRPENLKILQFALTELVGSKVSFRNINYGFNAGVAFKFLAKSYSEYLPNIYMCERLSGKWCIKCRKCFLYALSCLAYKVDADFNLGYFFQNSSYIKELMKDVDEAYSEGFDQINYVYKFAYPTHLCSTVQISHDIDLNYARKILWHKKYPDAFVNLIKIIEPFKNFSFTDYDAFWLRAFEKDLQEFGGDDNHTLLDLLKSRLSEASIPISEKFVFTGYNRNNLVSYDFS
ncbi:hypothetical protein [Halomonas sp. LC1]|uniref:hypothetical protein n=1 Tax=Halomonas sp. LC1 TaxID=3043733 RepID=UPI0025521A3B|nr:hypothetical protein [Halomonas sp. LC1]MDK9687560.1 hypothetical protein [Halomonas sp. LC1]